MSHEENERGPDSTRGIGHSKVPYDATWDLLFRRIAFLRCERHRDVHRVVTCLPPLHTAARKVSRHCLLGRIFKAMPGEVLHD